MAEQDNADGGLFAIEIDPDDYAAAATHENSSDATGEVPRTFQSEAAFQLIKDSYKAKHDDGNAYADLLAAVPALRSSWKSSPLVTPAASAENPANSNPSLNSHDDHVINGNGCGNDAGDSRTNMAHDKTLLDKRNTQLLGYAVAELYFAGDYEEVTALCERVRLRCELRDDRATEAVERWTDKATRRLERKAGG